MTQVFEDYRETLAAKGQSVEAQFGYGHSSAQDDIAKLLRAVTPIDDGKIAGMTGLEIGSVCGLFKLRNNLATIFRPVDKAGQYN